MAVLRGAAGSYLTPWYEPRREAETDDMLNGKTALVTGSSQGIGLAAAQALAANGAAVVLTSERPLEALRDVQRLLSDYPRTRYLRADLLADGEPERLAAEAWAA